MFVRTFPFCLHNLKSSAIILKIFRLEGVQLWDYMHIFKGLVI